MYESVLRDLIIDNKSGVYGLGLPAEPYSKGKVRYLRISDIDDEGCVVDTDMKSVTADNIEEYILIEDDLVVARTGNSTGRTYMYDVDDGIMAYAGFLIKYVFDDEKINPRYMKYFCLSDYYKAQIEGFMGSTRGNMSANDFKTINVIYPDRNNQDRMVYLLDLIDKKIKNNKKINDNLQQQLRLLYDYWFTQYSFPDDNGMPYKSAGGSMVWNSTIKDSIPAGWRVFSLKEVVQHIHTGLNPRDNFVLGNGSIKYITVKNLTINGKLDFKGCDTIDEKARTMVHNRSDIMIGDILFASIAPLGRCFLITDEPTDWDINESVFSIRPNSSISSEYLYAFLTSNRFISTATNSSTGSIFKGIRINDLLDTNVLVPCKSVLDSFTAFSKKLLRLKTVLRREIEELLSQRNWLLPMLMSGQATISD